VNPRQPNGSQRWLKTAPNCRYSRKPVARMPAVLLSNHPGRVIRARSASAHQIGILTAGEVLRDARAMHRWATILLIAVVSVPAFWMPNVIPFWRNVGSTGILTSLAIVAAAAFVRLARAMPTIPNEIIDQSLADELSGLFVQSVGHVRSLLLITLAAMIYITFIPMMYGPLEQMGVRPIFAEYLPSYIGFVFYFYVLSEALRALNLDFRLAELQACLARRAVSLRAQKASPAPSSSTEDRP